MKQELIAHYDDIVKSLQTKYLLWTIIITSGCVAVVMVIMRGAAVEWSIVSLALIISFVGIIAPRLAIRNIELKRAWHKQYATEGTFNVSTELYRAWRIPGVWYATIEHITNESELEQHSIELKQHFDPFLNRRMVQPYQLKNLSRGHYSGKSVTVLVGDIFGLTVLQRTIESPISFTVLPLQIKEEQDTFLEQMTSKRWVEKQSQPKQNTSASSSRTINGQEGSDSSGMINGLKPYSEGDSIHRIYYHGLAKGMGVHVLEEQEQQSLVKQVIFIDQYMPPLDTNTQAHHFNALIGWLIDRVASTLSEGPILVISDNWSYEMYELYQLDELKRLLTYIRADVQYPIVERLSSLAKIVPSYSRLTVYTTDWKNSESWTELAQLAWHKRVTVSLELLTEHRIMIYSMREQQRELEQNGLQTVWRYCHTSYEPQHYVREGREHYAFN